MACSGEPPLIDTVHFVCLGHVDPAIHETITPVIASVFGCRVPLYPRRMDIAFAFDERRGQYSSNAILHALKKVPHAPGDRILGVTSRDLFLPILTYVFGEALLEGPSAVVSLHRLPPEFYGLPPDAETFQRRAAVEAVHELGHTLGLVHCQEYDCAMHASHSADAIDLKNPDICAGCRAHCAVPR